MLVTLTGLSHWPRCSDCRIHHACSGTSTLSWPWWGGCLSCSCSVNTFVVLIALFLLAHLSRWPRLFRNQYFALAVVRGVLELRFNLGTGPAVIKTKGRVNTGKEREVGDISLLKLRPQPPKIKSLSIEQTQCFPIFFGCTYFSCFLY